MLALFMVCVGRWVGVICVCGLVLICWVCGVDWLLGWSVYGWFCVIAGFVFWCIVWFGVVRWVWLLPVVGSMCCFVVSLFVWVVRLY